MQVPPYVPQPIEIPQNVTQERYRLRVGFVRRVSFLHCLSLIFLVGLCQFRLITIAFPVTLASLLFVLALLLITRLVEKGVKNEQLISLCVMPFFFGLLAILLKDLASFGFPIWGLPVGIFGAQAYAFVSKRDLSYIVMFLSGLLTSVIVIPILGIRLEQSSNQILTALSCSLISLFYYVYDLASLLSRRRLGEEIGATIDLYRDPLNFISYTFRVLRHWQKYRIWGRI